MATRFWGIAIVLCSALSVMGGCAAEDDMFFISYNSYADPSQECQINAQLFIPVGRLDVADTYPSNPLVPGSTPVQNPKSYFAVMLLRTNVQKNPANTPPGRGGTSVYNYGGLPTTDILVEEVETQYVFSYNATQPSSGTLDAIPAQLLQPASSWVGPDTRAGKTGQYEGTSFLGVELVTTEIGNALGADPDLFDSLQYPNQYQIGIQIRARGRTTGGSRVQTNWSTYPLNLCRGCMVNNAACFDSTVNCYPPWQDC